jgi:hypothetical protein
MKAPAMFPVSDIAPQLHSQNQIPPQQSFRSIGNGHLIRAP